MSYKVRYLLPLLSVLALVALAGGAVLAQGGAIAYGETVTGSLTDAAPFLIYQFQGNAGDQITAYAFGTTPDLLLSLSLLGPNQQQLALSTRDLFGAEVGVARISYRLASLGPHFLMVSNITGQPGDFVLRLDRSSAVDGGELPADTPIGLDIPANALPTTLTFVVPESGSALAVESMTPGFGFLAQLYGPTGELLAGLTGAALPGAGLTLAPGAYALTIEAMLPDTTGSIQVLLSSSGQLPGQATPVPPPPAATPIPSVCTASSSQNVNVRSGPGTNYPAIGSLFVGSSLEVTGRNSDGSWVVTNFNGRQGWISTGVITLQGPCSALPFVVPPPSPTPIPPTLTPTPSAPIVQFWSTVPDGAILAPGTCVRFYWDTSNVQAVYFDGNPVVGTNTPTNGGGTERCPMTTTTYTLRVIYPDGSTHDFNIPVGVS